MIRNISTAGLSDLMFLEEDGTGPSSRDDSYFQTYENFTERLYMTLTRDTPATQKIINCPFEDSLMEDAKIAKKDRMFFSFAG